MFELDKFVYNDIISRILQKNKNKKQKKNYQSIKLGAEIKVLSKSLKNATQKQKNEIKKEIKRKKN